MTEQKKGKSVAQLIIINQDNTKPTAVELTAVDIAILNLRMRNGGTILIN